MVLWLPVYTKGANLKYTVDALAERIISTTKTIEGAAIVTVQVAVVEGEIQFITRPAVTNIEPRNRRDEFLRLLAFGAPGECSPIEATADDQEFEALFSGAEAAIVDKLGQAYNDFISLPVLHGWDSREFMEAIHKAQHIVLARPTKRALKTTSR